MTTGNRPPLHIDWLTLRFTMRTTHVDGPVEVVDDDGVVTSNKDGDRAPSANDVRRVFSNTNVTINDEPWTIDYAEGRWQLIGPPGLAGIAGQGANGERTVYDLPIQLRSMHGGIHLTFTGDYWRSYHRPDLYQALIHQAFAIAGAAKLGWSPTHCSASRIDLATEEPFGDFVARTARQYQLGENLPAAMSFGDHDVVDGELRVEAQRVRARLHQLGEGRRETALQHVHSPTGATWYVGYAGADAAKMREKEHFVRVYSKTTPPGVVRTVRREVECKDIPGENLGEQLQAAIDAAAVLLDVAPTSAQHLVDNTTQLAELDGRAKLSLQDYARRIIGMALTAEKRTLVHTKEVDRCLVALVSELTGSTDLAHKLVDAARRKRKPTR